MAVKPIKLKYQPIDFGTDCIDPMAQVVIAESLDYAIDTARKRLESAGRVMTSVELQGYPALEVVQGIRDAIISAPRCVRDLTSDEKLAVAALVQSDKDKKRIAADKRKEKEALELLTEQVWNLTPVAQREALAKKAGLAGTRGRAAYGNLKAGEWEKLNEQYLKLGKAAIDEKKKADKAKEGGAITRAEVPIAPETPPEPSTKGKILLIASKKVDPSDPKKTVVARWDVVDKDGKKLSELDVKAGNDLLVKGTGMLYPGAA